MSSPKLYELSFPSLKTLEIRAIKSISYIDNFRFLQSLGDVNQKLEKVSISALEECFSQNNFESSLLEKMFVFMCKSKVKLFEIKSLVEKPLRRQEIGILRRISNQNKVKYYRELKVFTAKRAELERTYRNRFGIFSLLMF